MAGVDWREKMLDPEKDQALCDAATPGPWDCSGELIYIAEGYQVSEDECDVRQVEIGAFNDANDSDFCCLARTLLPLYIAEVRRLTEENEKLKLSKNYWDALNEKLTLIGGERDAFELIVVELRDWQQRALPYIKGYDEFSDDGYIVTSSKEKYNLKQLIEEAK